MQTRTLYAGANRLTRHRLVPLDTPVASANARARVRRSACSRWNARWMSWLAGSGSIRSNSESATSLRRIRSNTSPIPAAIWWRAITRARSASAGTRGTPRPGQVREGGSWLIGMGMAAAIRGNTLACRLRRACIWGRTGVAVVPHGDDGYRHRQLHDPHPDRGGEMLGLPPGPGCACCCGRYGLPGGGGDRAAPSVPPVPARRYTWPATTCGASSQSLAGMDATVAQFEHGQITAQRPVGVRWRASLAPTASTPRARSGPARMAGQILAAILWRAFRRGRGRRRYGRSPAAPDARGVHSRADPE